MGEIFKKRLFTKRLPLWYSLQAEESHKEKTVFSIYLQKCLTFCSWESVNSIKTFPQEVAFHYERSKKTE